MIDKASTATGAAPSVPRSRIVIASMVGTSIEFFDFYIYATAAVDGMSPHGLLIGG
ncbi:hypothetical protein [Gordonia sp. CPCC 205333]|uniref:hypothetical protein n=1 Tax=Gordonia sp. CPCC 205333 TaxID=3140790 RepID=UPI003AF35B6A